MVWGENGGTSAISPLHAACRPSVRRTAQNKAQKHQQNHHHTLRAADCRPSVRRTACDRLHREEVLPTSPLSGVREATSLRLLCTGEGGSSQRAKLELRARCGWTHIPSLLRCRLPTNHTFTHTQSPLSGMSIVNQPPHRHAHIVPCLLRCPLSNTQSPLC